MRKSSRWATHARFRRSFGVGTATVLLAVATTIFPASAGSQTSAGGESAALDAATQWFLGQREAPNDAVNPGAYASLLGQAAGLPIVGSAWTERTPGNYFTDSPTYAPIGASCGANCFQNSGSGERYVSGRMTSVAVAKNGDVFAGAADGGIWKSTDRGQHWTALGDKLGTMSIGALLIDADNGSSYTVYAGTGEANTSSDSYAGVGVLQSVNGGAFTSLPTTANYPNGTTSDSDLTGALTFRLLRNGSYLYAATSHGLFRITPGDANWTRVLQFDNGATTPSPNRRVADMITDVIALPGTTHILAVAGWRAGAATNGLYESTDGGTTFSYLSSPTGWVPAWQQGRVTLTTSGNGGKIVAVIQDTSTFVKPNASGSILAGVFASTNGASGPWSRIASSGQLSSSGSAEARSGMRGYKPGVQAWYNQFAAVDPANPNHIYLGLEEVYETQDGGLTWNTLGPYWNLTLQCFSYTPFEGTCDHNQTHPDQHAVFVDTSNGRNTLFVGNDGGMWSRPMSDHRQGHWTSLNNNLNTLQYYSAAGSNDGSLYGGLQDNGTSLTFPTPGFVTGDTGTPVPATSVQVFGGDGGYTIVDPNNSQNAITEYVGLTSAYTHDGGKTWIDNKPGDPNARFIAPIVRDYTQSVASNGDGHILAGGRYVWDSLKGFNTTSTDWHRIYDLTLGTNASAQATAIGTATDANGVTTTWVGWCGLCNPPFHGGIVVLRDSGPNTPYTVVRSFGPSNGLPNRYVTGIFVNPANANDAYVTYSGYSRHWYVGPEDAGTGHVFQLSATAGTATDRSGNAIDAPTNDVVIVNGTLIVGTDFGVYASKDNGTHWARLGGNLPNAVVDQLTVSNGTMLAATHGRGLWSYAVAQLP